jgi:hypothetical protein
MLVHAARARARYTYYRHIISLQYFLGVGRVSERGGRESAGSQAEYVTNQPGERARPTYHDRASNGQRTAAHRASLNRSVRSNVL